MSYRISAAKYMLGGEEEYRMKREFRGVAINLTVRRPRLRSAGDPDDGDALRMPCEGANERSRV